MSFEVDRYSSAWAHIALCADLTWVVEPPDEFIIANQRLLAHHYRVSQILQDTAESQSSSNNQCELKESRHSASNQNSDNAHSTARRSAKDVIPESRLAQYYGNFYYDEVREKCYTNCNEKINLRGCNKPGCENSDLTECWMLPEVEYWFRKLMDDSVERGMMPRRRRQFKMIPDDDFGRWDPCGSQASDEEAALAARVLSVRPLWASRPARPPSPPTAPRKMRARRRQPRRVNFAPPPTYCLEVPPQLFCDPSCKFQFDSPRPPQEMECQRAMNKLSASVQATMMRAAVARYAPCRGVNVSRYSPTGQRAMRYPDKRYARMVWWPREHLSPRLEQALPSNLGQQNTPKVSPRIEPQQKTAEAEAKDQTIEKTVEKVPEPEKPPEQSESPKQKVSKDLPSTSAAIDSNSRKKRLYSTVLSTSAPPPISLAQIGCMRLAQKLVPPGLIKLNSKIILPSARVRPPNVEHKFEELEKEALEQYKASDESIDTKFRELEKQAVEQYSTSNSNTSCSSGNSAEKRNSASPPANDSKNKPAKFHKEKTVDSVVIYSQNFPDLNSKTSSDMNLKNFHGPPRGEKKEVHRQGKSRNKGEQKCASDTDYEAREANYKSNKSSVRCSWHVVPPKKRHLALCVSDFSSDEDIVDVSKPIKDRGPRAKGHISGKVKMSAHGGGDLRPIMRKT